MQNIKRRMIPLALSAIIALSTQVYAKAIPIDIVVQPLASALTQFADQAHVQVLVSQELVSGKVAPEVRGELEPIDALKALLKNSGLEAISQNGTLVIKKSEKAQEESLEKITLIGNAKPDEGSVEAGYKVDTVKNVGPWTDMKLQDAPYSINVLSNDFIKNTQISSPDQIIRISPLLSLNLPTTLNARPKFNIRGFTGLSNIYEDGIYNYNGWVGQLEDIDRVEILTGLSGFLYGAGNVGGLINYVHKKPLLFPQTDITIGNAGTEGYLTSIDTSGLLNESKSLRYRLNIAKQDGNSQIDNQDLDRYLISGILEWEPIENIIFDVSASKQHYKADGVPAYWSFSGLKHADVAIPDASKLWSQKWSYNELDTDKIGTNMRWKLTDSTNIRVGYMHSEYEQDQISMTNTITSTNLYKQVFTDRAPRTLFTDAGYLYFDTNLLTNDIKHNITVGIQDDKAKWRMHKDGSYSATIISNASLAYPSYVAEPMYSIGNDNEYTSSEASRKNILASDKIVFNDSWSAIIGVNQATITQKAYLTSGVENPSGHYDDSKITPSMSLIYKPLDYISIYTSYIEALEQGLIVPIRAIYTNSGEALPPMKSTQYEAGAKIDFNNIYVTTALFKIDKSNQYALNNADGTKTYTQDGRQINKGLEFTIGGKVSDNLTLIGGATFMNSEVEKQKNNPQFEGKKPIDVAENIFKIYGEYDIPAIHGLTMTGGIYYTGDFYADGINSDKLPAVTTADLGARYTQKINGYQTTFRLNVTNLTDKTYWISSNYVGEPRIVWLSASIKF